MKICIVGGAGFIGSHIVDLLVERGDDVTVFDNFSVGKRAFLSTGSRIILGDALDLTKLTDALEEQDTVLHFAANPEARAGLENTVLDLEQGTIATYHVLEAARRNGVKRVVLASSGTVYGRRAEVAAEHDLGLLPISFYGAAKFAGEALVSSFSECFGMHGTIMRFGNVVGKRATHGAILDFCKKLKATPDRLEVLGDGKQSKPYLHVTECAKGVIFALDHDPGPLGIYNLAPDSWTSVRTIAEMCVAASPNEKASIVYTGGVQGWKGDVPVSRMDANKLAALGYRVSFTSDEAVHRAVEEVASEVFQ